MAALNILTFDLEGRPIEFNAWLDNLHLFRLIVSKDGTSLFDLTSGTSPAPDATGDSPTRSQWLTCDAAARLAVRNHLPLAERAHFGQHKTAKALYDAVVPRYSSPATAALSHLLLPYLFPELSAFATAANLVTHLHTMGGAAAAGAGEAAVGVVEVEAVVGAVEEVEGAAVEEVVVVGVEGQVAGVVAAVGVVEAAVVAAVVAAVGVEAAAMVVAGVGTSQRGGLGGGQRQQQHQPLSSQKLREWFAQRGAAGSSGPCAYVIRTGDRTGQTCRRSHTQHRCFYHLTDAFRAEFPNALELPNWAELLRQNVDIFALDFDAILSAMYALTVSAEGDCYLCMPPDPGIEAAALGAIEYAALDACESALSGTASAAGPHTFTLDSGASRCFYRDSTTVTPLSAPVLSLWLTPLGAQSLHVPPLFCPDWRFRLGHCRVSTSLVLYELVLRLHSDRGGEFSSDLLRVFCRAEGIPQTFTLLASTHQNGVAEHRIGLVMEVARTSMIHEAAPHFLWPFAVQYAAHQLNLWPLSPCRRPRPQSSSVDPLPPQGPAPSGVPQVDPLEPVKVAVDSGDARGVASGVLSLRVRDLRGLWALRVRSLGVLSLEALRVSCHGRSLSLHCSCASGLLSAGASGVVLLELELLEVLEPLVPEVLVLEVLELLGLEVLLELLEVLVLLELELLEVLLEVLELLGLEVLLELELLEVLLELELLEVVLELELEFLEVLVLSVLVLEVLYGTSSFLCSTACLLPSPPASSIADGPNPESDSLHAASRTITRLLATVVTNPSFESTAASALVAELVNFAPRCRLDYAASLVAE
ncbi:unnamed protein product [Closterium sp. NIES-65]|nr:unnamed protein product [Closterium sp. NIES-65]